MNQFKKIDKLFGHLAIFCFILLNSCAITPQNEKGDFKKSDLVELIKLDSTFKLDIRYASSNNFVGRPQKRLHA